MAVLAQVHLAVNRYGIALKKYEDASELEEVSGNLAAMLQRNKKREDYEIGRESCRERV